LEQKDPHIRQQLSLVQEDLRKANEKMAKTYKGFLNKHSKEQEVQEDVDQKQS
jgi:type III secretory pathway component EscR